MCCAMSVAKLLLALRGPGMVQGHEAGKPGVHTWMLQLGEDILEQKYEPIYVYVVQ